MIATLTWKEYREQSTIWVALAVLGVAVLAGLTAILAPQGAAAAGPDQAALLVVAAAGMALTCGLVCGAQTLAGEAEGGTLPFLDSQPVLRRQVWAAKLVPGLSLTLLQGLLLGGVAAWLDLHGGLSWSWYHGGGGLSRWDWLCVLPAVALEAYCWGLLGSALCENVLVAVVVAAMLLIGPWVLATPPSWQEEPLALLVRAGLALAALTVSALIFTRLDRERGFARVRAARRRSAAARPSDAGVLLWLAARQGRGWLLALAVAAFVSALLLAGYGPVFWPVLTLVVGVVCGSTVFLGEQSEGTYRFLGEQRLPPGRVWLWKTGFWLAAAVGVSGLVLLAGGFHAGIAAAHTPEGGHSGGGGRPWLYLVPPLAAAGLWLLSGFSIAQTCSLVWRRSAAALFMALVLSAAVSSAWVPSLLAGGLPSWQVLVVPALLLGFNARAMRAWLGGRFYTWRPLAGLVLCVAAAAAWMAGCLWYRVAEVPATGEGLDVQAFVASLPPPEQNEAGSLIRQAMARLKEEEGRAASAVVPPNAPRPPVPAAGEAAPAAPLNIWNQADQVVQKGWAGHDQELDAFLDALFQESWAGTLRQGAALPLGMILDPRHLTVTSDLDVIQQSRWAGIIFTARGLQLQARGNDAAGLDHLLTALALSRQLRSRAVPVAWMVGLSVEQAALEGLGHWLERVGSKPELLRRALDELGRHEEALPPPTDPVLADYLTLQNSLDQPTHLLRWSYGADQSPAQRVTEEMLDTAWQAPWEKARAERILRATTAGRLRGVEAGYAAIGARRQAEGFRPLFPGEQALEGWLPADSGEGGAAARRRLARLIQHSWLAEALMFSPNLPLAQAAGLCRVRGTRLQLALALYQATEGNPAAALDDLVPRYLPALPRDPFSPEDQGFSYRLSEGEDVEWGTLFPAENQQVRHVAPGEGIVWSDGVDLTDNGGHRQGMTTVLAGPQPGQTVADWIFVVPRRAER